MTARTPPGTEPSGSEAGRDLAASLEKVWVRRGPALEPDRRLAELARWLAGEESKGISIDVHAAESAARRLGIPFPTPAALAITFGQTTPSSALEDQLARSLEGLPANVPFARYGLGVAAQGDLRVAVIVLSSAEVSFEPVPRHTSRGRTLILRGGVAQRFSRSRLSVTAPDGTGRDVERGGRSFEHKIPLARAGIYQIELLGDGESGPVVVANFPVFVDVPEPALAAPIARSPEALPATPAAAEERLLALVNQERKRAGAAPVAPSASLASVATGHSQDMAEHGFFGHVSPTTGTTGDRVTRAGLVLAAFGENVGAGSSPEEVHRELMASPAHRAVLLDRRFSQVGVGVVLRSGEAVPVVVTELFGEPPKLVDPATGRAELLALINARRSQKRLGAIRSVPELEAAAAKGLALELSDPSATLEQATQVITADLGKSQARIARLGIRTLGVLGTRVYAQEELLGSPQIEGAVRGVGIAISGPVGAPPRQVAVVVLGVE